MASASTGSAPQSAAPANSPARAATVRLSIICNCPCPAKPPGALGARRVLGAIIRRDALAHPIPHPPAPGALRNDAACTCSSKARQVPALHHHATTHMQNREKSIDDLFFK